MAVNDLRTTTRPSSPRTDELKLETLEPSLASTRTGFENRAHRYRNRKEEGQRWGSKVKGNSSGHRRPLFKPPIWPTRAGHRAQTPSRLRAEAHELAAVVEKPTSTHHARRRTLRFKKPTRDTLRSREPPGPEQRTVETQERTPRRSSSRTEKAGRDLKEKIDLQPYPKKQTATSTHRSTFSPFFQRKLRDHRIKTPLQRSNSRSQTLAQNNAHIEGKRDRWDSSKTRERN